MQVMKKKVLLPERNRRTARCVASTRHAVPVGVPPCPDLGPGRGGYPILLTGGYPILLMGGYPLSGPGLGVQCTGSCSQSIDLN